MSTGVRIDPASSVHLGSMTWLAIIDELPRSLRVRTRKRNDEYKRFVEAVIWVAWVDARWDELPSTYGSWRTVYARYLRWNRRRLWDAVAPHIGTEASTHLLRLAAECDQRRARRQFPVRPRTTVSSVLLLQSLGTKHEGPNVDVSSSAPAPSTQDRNFVRESSPPTFHAEEMM